MGDADLDELLAVAVEVARRAAALAVARRADGIGEVGTKSTATDLVTAADRAVERLIGELLRERRPGDGVLGEEYGGELPMGARQALAPSRGRRPRPGALGGRPDRRHRQLRLRAAALRRLPRRRDRRRGRGRRGPQRGHRRGVDRGPGRRRVARRTPAGLLAGRPIWARPWSPRGSATTPPDGPTRPPYCRCCCRGCATSAGSGRRRWTCASPRRAGWTRTSRRGLGAWDHAAGGLVAVESGLRVTGLRGARPGPAMVLAALPGLHPELHALLVELDADGGP